MSESFIARVKPLNWLKVDDLEWGQNYEIAEIRFGGYYRLDRYPTYGGNYKYAAAYHNGLGHEFLFGVSQYSHAESYIWTEAEAKAAVQRHYEERVRWVLEITTATPTKAQGQERNAMTTETPCPKAPHTGTGYLHAEDYDGPYDVDGVEYCGRCHYAIGFCRASNVKPAEPQGSEPPMGRIEASERAMHANDRRMLDTYRAENAALKARVEELENLMMAYFINHEEVGGGCLVDNDTAHKVYRRWADACGEIIHRQAAEARKEQDAIDAYVNHQPTPKGHPMARKDANDPA